MNVLSLFSGAGGMDRGLEAAGMDIVGMCEIDPTARSVLARHWPDVPIHDDVTTLDPKEWNGRVDLVAGGSPCQDLSVAGRRAGLDGGRSGLFWHQCRIADSVAAPWVLWENVAGAFSSNGGADFAAVLWGLTGTLPDVPDGGWRTAGVVVGPKRTAVWRLLDARWFGVAQRRRRVFVVAGPRNLCRPEVLLEPEGVRGNPAPSRETGAGTAGRAARGSRHGGGWRIGADEAAAGHLTLTTSLERMGAPEVDAGLYLPSTIGTVTTAFDSKNATNHQEVLSGAVQAVGPNAVRRLTPSECEALMSWQRDWTRYRADGTEIADSHRYRMCGNGVVSNVAQWIGNRIMENLR